MRDTPTLESFLEDRKTYCAVERKLYIICDIIKKIGEQYPALKEQYIHWHKIKGFRNVLAHDYMGIEQSVVWDICTQDFIDLKKITQEALAHLS